MFHWSTEEPFKRLSLHLVNLLPPLPGCLIGYLVQSKKEAVPSCAEPSTYLPEAPPNHETGAAPLMDWDDVKKFLGQKLSAEAFDSVLR